MNRKYNFRTTESLTNLTRPKEHDKMKSEQKAFQVFNDKGHLTRQLGMLNYFTSGSFEINRKSNWKSFLVI